MIPAHPPDIADMIDADVQALVWAHVPEFDVEAEGRPNSATDDGSPEVRNSCCPTAREASHFYIGPLISKRCMQPPG